MNLARVIAAAVAATLVDAVYGMLVYGGALSSQFSQYPQVYRPNEAQAAYLLPMFLGIFIGMIAVAIIYAKGYEGKGPGAMEGIRFGAIFGLFACGFFTGVNYGVLNIGAGLALSMAAAGIVEWLLIGAAIGAIYRANAAPVRQAARV